MMEVSEGMVTEMDALIVAVEAGDNADVQAIAKGMARDFRDNRQYWPAYDIENAMSRGSLDAAKSLHVALLPGWGYQVWKDDGNATVEVWKSEKLEYLGVCDSPARAWLLAILRAYRAKIGGAS